MDQNPDSLPARRIVLPSGRSIELVKLDSQVPPAPGLHICPQCTSLLVQPVSWREVQPRSWTLTLCCPDCDFLTHGVFAQEQVDRFEEQLDLGLAEMLNDLRRLTQANMAGEIERFVAALYSGLILPEDF